MDTSAVRNTEYKTCEHVVTSDHLPVLASFELDVPLAPSLSAYSEPCDIYLGHLCLTIADQRGEIRVDEAREKLYLCFHGSFLSEASRGKRTGLGRTEESSEHVAKLQAAREAGRSPRVPDTIADRRRVTTWHEAELPLLRSVIGARAYVARECIYFVVKKTVSDSEFDGKGATVGQGVIRMHDVLQGTGQSKPSASPSSSTSTSTHSSTNPSPQPRPVRAPGLDPGIPTRHSRPTVYEPVRPTHHIRLPPPMRDPPPPPPSFLSERDSALHMSPRDASVSTPGLPSMATPVSTSPLSSDTTHFSGSGHDIVSWHFFSAIETNSRVIGTLSGVVYVSFAVLHSQ